MSSCPAPSRAPLSSPRLPLRASIRLSVVVMMAVCAAGAQEAVPAADAAKVVLLKRAENASDAIADADAAASAYWSIGALLCEEKEADEARRVLLKAREKALAVKERARRWELVEIIAREEGRAGAEVDLAAYLAGAENEAQQSAVISSVAMGCYENGRTAEARTLFDRAWQAARKISGPYKEVFYLSLAEDAVTAGDAATAREFHVRFRDYVRMLGGEAEALAMRKLGEAQLEAGHRDDALKSFQEAARLALQGKTPEDVGEVAGLMAGGGFISEAEALVDDFMAAVEKWEPASERSGLTALFADTLNREGAFPRKVLKLLERVSVDDRVYLLPEALMNLASADGLAEAAALLPDVEEPQDRISVMCALADASFKAGSTGQVSLWVERALATARTIKDEEIRRETLLEIAEQQAAAGMAEEARKTWREVADAGEEFRRAIQEREFFQMVEAHDWQRATAALAAMANSPDISVLRSGMATELAKQGEVRLAMQLVADLPDAWPARLEIVRLAYEKLGSILTPADLPAELAKHSDPEIMVSLIIGHVGGFRRVPKSG